ncbi:hypothetical protein BH11ARM2_BH11ARM2_38670 [soil metagenome]
MPKPTYLGRQEEVRFYEVLFALVDEWVTIDSSHVDRAIQLGCQYDIVNMDALHIAVAESANVDHFLTSERSSKPLFRARHIRPLHFLDL